MLRKARSLYKTITIATIPIGDSAGTEPLTVRKSVVTAEQKINDCKSVEHTCCRCKGIHQTWSLECPDRAAEQARLGQFTSPFFTS